MNEPLDELYLQWLYAQVGSVRLRSPRKTYWALLRQLYTKEFHWFVPNDDNRVEDGRDLRHEFCSDEGISDVDPAWMELGCSMLEMLIGLSRRLAFEAEGQPRDWFWHLLGNLDLTSCNDIRNQFSSEGVDEVLERVIWRTYDHDGRGGLFPLKRADEDQRRVEIWYQLSAYLLQA